VQQANRRIAIVTEDEKKSERRIAANYMADGRIIHHGWESWIQMATVFKTNRRRKDDNPDRVD
jgi:hypothetical protein